MRIVVVGGSLGGLSAALLLRDAGHEVDVLERSASPLEERGAGIGLLRETSRYLTERAGFDFDRICVATGHIRHLRRDGSTEHEVAHAYRFSSWNTIYRHLLAEFGSSRYLLGHEVVELATVLPRASHEAEGVQAAAEVVGVRCANGSVFEADLVVCADGVGSRFRSVFQTMAAPAYSGYVAWRGTIPESQLDKAVVERLGDAITYYVYANSHILVYPIPAADGSVDRGNRLMNFVWYRNYLEGSDLDDLLTGSDGIRREVSVPPGLVRPEHVSEMRAHATARLPESLAAVVVSAAAPFIQVVLDVEVERMVFGRVCLLGDAAWVARPHAAAGTAKAADDAWALAECLANETSVDRALAMWEERQLSMGRQLVERTRAIGRESQFDGTWEAGDPSHIFGLSAPGT